MVDSPKEKRPLKPRDAADGRESDDLVSVARRIGADEDKKRFEEKLGKIARAKPKD